MHVEGARGGQLQKRRREHGAVVEREDEVGASRGHLVEQRGVVQVVVEADGQVELRGRVGDAPEPHRLVRMIAMRDDQRHVDAGRMQDTQAAIADVRIGEDDGSHRGASASEIAGDCSTVLMR